MTKVLFVCRGKPEGNISPVVSAQMESLRPYAEIMLFPIFGKGVKSYIKSIPRLRQFVKSNEPDIIHAHYAHSGFVAAFSGSRQVICSLMGSDIEDYRLSRMFIRFFARFLWRVVIVKSKGLKTRIGIKNALVIPNGVDFNVFEPVPLSVAREILQLEKDKKYVLFLADPARWEKNYDLAVECCRQLIGHCELLVVFNKPHKEIALHLSAADVLLLTSRFEGSPNVIKEAMACGCPIVSTNVGDVKEICGDTEGTYICSPDPIELSRGIEKAFLFGKRTSGREKIKNVESDLIAKQIISLYNNMLNIK